jgi:hypothetical protein
MPSLPTKMEQIAKAIEALRDHATALDQPLLAYLLDMAALEAGKQCIASEKSMRVAQAEAGA